MKSIPHNCHALMEHYHTLEMIHEQITHTPSKVLMCGSPVELHDFITIVSTTKTCSMTLMKSYYCNLNNDTSLSHNRYEDLRSSDESVQRYLNYYFCQALHITSVSPLMVLLPHVGLPSVGRGVEQINFHKKSLLAKNK
jgi:hypothetical protein